MAFYMGKNQNIYGVFFIVRAPERKGKFYDTFSYHFIYFRACTSTLSYGATYPLSPL